MPLKLTRSASRDLQRLADNETRTPSIVLGKMFLLYEWYQKEQEKRNYNARACIISEEDLRTLPKDVRDRIATAKFDEPTTEFVIYR
jgi:hypothetical protein